MTKVVAYCIICDLSSICKLTDGYTCYFPQALYNRVVTGGRPETEFAKNVRYHLLGWSRSITKPVIEHRKNTEKHNFYALATEAFIESLCMPLGTIMCAANANKHLHFLKCNLLEHRFTVFALMALWINCRLLVVAEISFSRFTENMMSRACAKFLLPKIFWSNNIFQIGLRVLLSKELPKPHRSSGALLHKISLILHKRHPIGWLYQRVYNMKCMFLKLSQLCLAI